MNRTIKKQIWLNREEDCELKRKGLQEHCRSLETILISWRPKRTASDISTQLNWKTKFVVFINFRLT